MEVPAQCVASRLARHQRWRTWLFRKAACAEEHCSRGPKSPGGSRVRETEMAVFIAIRGGGLATRPRRFTRDSLAMSRRKSLYRPKRIILRVRGNCITRNYAAEEEAGHAQIRRRPGSDVIFRTAREPANGKNESPIEPKTEREKAGLPANAERHQE